jgi:hypothetical protein
MVSKHYQPGMAVSMKEVRIVTPIKTGCALAIHTSVGRYEVVQEGILFCMSHLTGFSKLTLKKGDIMHADDREHCYNECIQLGHKGYMMEEKHMPTQPTVHPADKRQFKHDKLIGDQTAADKNLCCSTLMYKAGGEPRGHIWTAWNRCQRDLQYSAIHGKIYNTTLCHNRTRCNT